MQDSDKSYFGPIELDSVNNIPSSSNPNMPIMQQHYCRIVHYSDCQQLVIMLPEYYEAFTNLIIKNLKSAEIIYEKQINDIINGSVQIIIDSLFIPDGKFKLTINRKDNGMHILFFTKNYPTATPKKEIPKGIQYDSRGYIIYRDGFGNILPNEDLDLRDELADKLKTEFFPDISYYSQGRDGYLIYKEQNKSLRLEMEMGGGKAMFMILLPEIEKWEAMTAFSLADRERIITIIARETQKQQAGGAKYEIRSNEIVYFR